MQSEIHFAGQYHEDASVLVVGMVVHIESKVCKLKRRSPPTNIMFELYMGPWKQSYIIHGVSLYHQVTCQYFFDDDTDSNRDNLSNS
jgi:hypothetical protein